MKRGAYRGGRRRGMKCQVDPYFEQTLSHGGGLVAAGVAVSVQAVHTSPCCVECLLGHALVDTPVAQPMPSSPVCHPTTYPHVHMPLCDFCHC